MNALWSIFCTSCYFGFSGVFWSSWGFTIHCFQIYKNLYYEDTYCWYKEFPYSVIQGPFGILFSEWPQYLHIYIFSRMEPSRYYPTFLSNLVLKDGLSIDVGCERKKKSKLLQQSLCEFSKSSRSFYFKNNLVKDKNLWLWPWVNPNVVETPRLFAREGWC